MHLPAIFRLHVIGRVAAVVMGLADTIEGSSCSRLGNLTFPKLPPVVVQDCYSFRYRQRRRLESSQYLYPSVSNDRSRETPFRCESSVVNLVCMHVTAGNPLDSTAPYDVESS
jgi:hypothetical protein